MRVWFTRPLTPLVAILACAVGVASVIGLPFPPASRMASVASAQAQAPGPASVAPATPTAKATTQPAKAAADRPTLAPRRPHADPISQAKAVLVAPATFAVGGITAIDSTGSVGDAFEWRISPSDRPFLIGDGRKQAWSFRNAGEPGVADPFAVTLLVFTKAKDGTVTSVDVATAIVKPAGVVVVAPPVVAPPVVVDPSVPPVVDPATKPTAAYYVFEKDDGAVPPAVQTGLDRLLREKKIDARSIEQDVTDGTDRTPEVFKAPIAAAKQAGLPALVVLAGDEILSVTKNPTTEAAILKEVP
jgi:hypothetical protein